MMAEHHAEKKDPLMVVVFAPRGSLLGVLAIHSQDSRAFLPWPISQLKLYNGWLFRRGGFILDLFSGSKAWSDSPHHNNDKYGHAFMTL